LSRTIGGLAPYLRPWARWLIAQYPYGTLTSTRRSRREQATLYRNYLAGHARYPAAPPGHSLHEQGRAFDYVAPEGVLRALGEIWESVGGRWGGRNRDPIHFEA
jgi:hypothetical protein